ncbi:bifunctional GNAT family N-acetyltransferase/acetate--CoA ligase family protein [Nocardioides sp. cx-173]|uniref:bifunctional acetate--CoA ligase family protein/GNAT family N-acetyltransferase n=1 Tax=Nocardioides sp. cx-173 TaxID=2898796 RepID=UPI001E5E322D|nr:bifunctional GNAT family N-acetyltransferase/acetate--CoA ligase family protein [Nocardioides sp. cx-173]MCD4527320.1 bifunctional GNAT family N-acetyltransferase/acetate--CoA ligase family protein [Nocardioides sp. cx-173]UGB43618.1 bifunctional GNAT family N-acetyltransferase/acetate--CoA ligase family protein [Nocardioides sp. cx-173]
MSAETTEETIVASAPRHWEADVLLRDGRTAHIRPIQPEDADLLVEFYARVSDQSKYYRFFSPMPTLSERDVKRFTRVDHQKRVALVLMLQGQMIAVGRFDVVAPGEAEVAFLVEDRHHGRGIAQLLLEHLAQAGRERGVERFTAEVLPDNHRMIQTFRDAGYRIASEYEEGVLMLEFSIDPTETAIGVMRGREHRAEAASIERFFNPRSVAVIGASRRQDTIGQTLVRNLVTGDFTGRVYVVNQSASAVSGMPAYKSVGEIPDDVDVAIVAVPADAVEDVVLDCAAKGVHGLIVVSSGFAETGDEGRKRQRRLVGLSRSYGLRLIGPNCLGVINTDPAVSVNASLSSVMPARGRAGFFCQSGALGSAILEKVKNRGLGLSTFVSAGNRADVSGNDLLQYWEEDDSTEVVLLYLESIGNPRKFSRIARRVSLRKPIIAVRSGRTTQGVPMGHSVRRIAAPPQAVDAMFRQAGVIQVDTLEEMFDVAQLLAHQPLPRGRRVAVVGNSDALGLLAVDAAVSVGLVVNKSVALGAEATADDFEDALDAAIDDPDIDSVIAVYIPPLNVSGEDVANVLAAVGEQSDKPLVSSFLGAEGVPELLRVPDVAGSTAGRGSVPSYPAVEAAVRALARVVDYAVWLRTPDGSVPDPAEVDLAGARRLVTEALAAHPEGVALETEQTAELLAAYGIDLWECRRVATLSEAQAAGHELGWDVVLKATSHPLRERPDLAHVWRNIDNRDEMLDAWTTLTELVGDPASAGFVVQRNAPPGVPVSIRSIEDPLFGPVVSFGISGPIIELLADKSYRIPPLGVRDAASMVREIKSSPMLFGYRGADVVDVEEIERLISRVAQLQNDLPQVSALELALVLVGTSGASVLTATARVDPVTDPRSDLFVRRMPELPGDTVAS